MEEAAQTGAPQSGSPAGSRVSWLVYIMIFLLVYLLGVGPAAWLVNKVPATEKVLGVVSLHSNIWDRNVRLFSVQLPA